jgi:hypothetical protein
LAGRVRPRPILEARRAAGVIIEDTAMNEPAPLSDLAGQINAEHAACLASARDAVTRAIEVGRLLASAKGQVRHGEWAGWVEANCTFGLRQAQSYMRAHHNRAELEEQMRSGASHLTGLHSAVAALASPRHGDDDGEDLDELDDLVLLERAAELTAGPPGPTGAEARKGRNLYDQWQDWMGKVDELLIRFQKMSIEDITKYWSAKAKADYARSLSRTGAGLRELAAKIEGTI